VVFAQRVAQFVEYLKSTLLLAGYIVFTFVTELPQPVELANNPLQLEPLQVAANTTAANGKLLAITNKVVITRTETSLIFRMAFSYEFVFCISKKNISNYLSTITSIFMKCITKMIMTSVTFLFNYGNPYLFHLGNSPMLSLTF
jgi:hypothetical protein